jgi:hypothetical protein
MLVGTGVGTLEQLSEIVKSPSSDAVRPSTLSQ